MNQSKSRQVLGAKRKSLAVQIDGNLRTTSHFSLLRHFKVVLVLFSIVLSLFICTINNCRFCIFHFKKVLIISVE